MSLWSSYRALGPRTKFFLGVGLMSYAAFGMWASPKVEKALGMTPTEQEQEQLDRKLNIKLSRVDRPDN